MICTCYALFKILKNCICFSFDEIKFNCVTWVFYNEVNNEFYLMRMFYILSILLLS